MQEGLANVAVLTGARTVLRQRVEVSIPRKRGGRASDHDKVSENWRRGKVEGGVDVT